MIDFEELAAVNRDMDDIGTYVYDDESDDYVYIPPANDLAGI